MIKPEIISSKPIFMVIKTPKIKYADSGFLKRTQNALHVELFNAGVPILNLQLNESTCINKICYKNEQFNIQFLGYMYDKEMLKDILQSKPIYGGENLIKMQNGFIQKIEDKNKKINYQVGKDSLTFKDRINKIFIKIKHIKN